MQSSDFVRNALQEFTSSLTAKLSLTTEKLIWFKVLKPYIYTQSIKLDVLLQFGHSNGDRTNLSYTSANNERKSYKKMFERNCKYLSDIFTVINILISVILCSMVCFIVQYKCCESRAFRRERERASIENRFQEDRRRES